MINSMDFVGPIHSTESEGGPDQFGSVLWTIPCVGETFASASRVLHQTPRFGTMAHSFQEKICSKFLGRIPLLCLDGGWVGQAIFFPKVFGPLILASWCHIMVLQ